MRTNSSSENVCGADVVLAGPTGFGLCAELLLGPAAIALEKATGLQMLQRSTSRTVVICGNVAL